MSFADLQFQIETQTLNNLKIEALPNGLESLALLVKSRFENILPDSRDAVLDNMKAEPEVKASIAAVWQLHFPENNGGLVPLRFAVAYQSFDHLKQWWQPSTLIDAAKQGYADIVAYGLANFTFDSETKHKALMQGVVTGNSKTVECFSGEVITQNKNEALKVAAKKGSKKVAELLLSKGADHKQAFWEASGDVAPILFARDEEHFIKEGAANEKHAFLLDVIDGTLPSSFSITEVYRLLGEAAALILKERSVNILDDLIENGTLEDLIDAVGIVLEPEEAKKYIVIAAKSKGKANIADYFTSSGTGKGTSPLKQAVLRGDAEAVKRYRDAVSDPFILTGLLDDAIAKESEDVVQAVSNGMDANILDRRLVTAGQAGNVKELSLLWQSAPNAHRRVTDHAVETSQVEVLVFLREKDELSGADCDKVLIAYAKDGDDRLLALSQSRATPDGWDDALIQATPQQRAILLDSYEGYSLIRFFDNYKVLQKLVSSDSFDVHCRRDALVAAKSQRRKDVIELLLPSMQSEAIHFVRESNEMAIWAYGALDEAGRVRLAALAAKEKIENGLDSFRDEVDLALCALVKTGQEGGALFLIPLASGKGVDAAIVYAARIGSERLYDTLAIYASTEAREEAERLAMRYERPFNALQSETPFEDALDAGHYKGVSNFMEKVNDASLEQALSDRRYLLAKKIRSALTEIPSDLTLYFDAIEDSTKLSKLSDESAIINALIMIAGSSDLPTGFLRDVSPDLILEALKVVARNGDGFSAAQLLKYVGPLNKNAVAVRAATYGTVDVLRVLSLENKDVAIEAAKSYGRLGALRFLKSDEVPRGQKAPDWDLVLAIEKQDSKTVATYARPNEIALFISLKMGNTDILELLISSENRAGALEVAAKNGFERSFAYLLQQADGIEAANTAAKNGHDTLVHIYARRRPDLACGEAAENGFCDLLRALTRIGYEVPGNVVSKAYAKGKYEAIDVALALGANPKVNPFSKPENGRKIAAKYGYVHLMNYLKTDDREENIFLGTVAATCGHVKIVQKLFVQVPEEIFLAASSSNQVAVFEDLDAGAHVPKAIEMAATHRSYDVISYLRPLVGGAGLIPAIFEARGDLAAMKLVVKDGSEVICDEGETLDKIFADDKVPDSVKQYLVSQNFKLIATTLASHSRMHALRYLYDNDYIDAMIDELFGCACGYGSQECIEYLLEEATENGKDQGLINGASCGNVVAVELLLTPGTDVAISLQAYTGAAKNGHVHMLKHFQETFWSERETEALKAAARGGQVEVVASLTAGWSFLPSEFPIARKLALFEAVSARRSNVASQLLAQDPLLLFDNDGAIIREAVATKNYETIQVVIGERKKEVYLWAFMNRHQDVVNYINRNPDEIFFEVLEESAANKEAAHSLIEVLKALDSAIRDWYLLMAIQFEKIALLKVLGSVGINDVDTALKNAAVMGNVNAVSAILEMGLSQKVIREAIEMAKGDKTKAALTSFLRE